MSLNNENNPSVFSVAVGSLAVDAVMPLTYCKKKMRLLSVELMNGADIAASDTDYAILYLKDSDDNVYATLDTRAAGQGAVSEFVWKAFSVSDAEIPAGSSLKLVHDETDTGSNVALTDAVINANWCGW